MKKLFAAMILIIGSLAQAQDAHEPNNTFDTASPITPGQPLEATIHGGGNDIDYYTFDVEVAGPVVIETFGDAGDSRMWLYGENQAQIAYNDDGGDGLFSRIQRDTMAPGTYFIKVDEFGNNANISYNLRVNLIEGELRVGTPEFSPAPQPNRTWGLAIDIINANAGPVDGTSASLTVAGENLAPCNVPALAGNASHTCRWSNLAPLPAGYHLARVCADANFAVGELNENDNCAEFLAPPLVAGDPDAYEPNNTFEEAAEINHGDDLVLTTHNNGQDIDYFRFTLDRQANLVIQTRPVVADDSDSRIQLFDEEQQLVTQAGFGFGHPILTRNNMAAGTYYIRTEEFGNNAQMRYILSLRMVTGAIGVGEVTLDPQPLVGQAWGLTASVQNNHNANSPELVAQLRINDEAQADCAVPALEPGRNHSCSWEELAGLNIGAHTIEFCADTGNAVLENDENNNCRTLAVNLGPDLQAQGLTLNPVSPDVGDVWAATATLVNTNNDTAGASTASLRRGDDVLGTCDVPELGLGETHECSWQDLAGLPNGRSEIRVCADSAGAVEELNEENNCAVRNLALGYDMVVRDLVLDPMNPGADQIWSATATVRNRFNPETPITQAGLYLDDQLLARCEVEALAADGSTECVFEDQPAPPAGRHQVRFCADIDEEIDERSEDNNCTDVTIYNGPDLQVQNVLLNPAEPLRDRDTQFVVLVFNGTADEAAGSTVTLTEEGNALGNCPVTPLAGNAVGVCMINGLRFEGGDHTINVCADGNDEVVEIDEDNNCSEVNFTIENVDEYEPDNDRATATIINAGEAQDHNLHNNDDQDFVRFFINEASEVTIETLPVEEDDSFDTRLVLQDAEGQQLAQNDNGGVSPFSRIITELQPGTYYARVSRARGAAAERYRISLSAIRLADRPPNLSTGGFTLAPNEPEASEAFVTTFVVTNANDAGVSEASLARLTIDDETRGECAVPELESGASHNCEIAVPGGMTAGERVLRVCVDPDGLVDERDENDNCSELERMVWGGDEYEPDNDAENATELVVDEDQTHSFHRPDDSDWVLINLAVAGTLTVTAGGVGVDVDAELMSEGGEELAASTSRGDAEIVYGPVDAGVFYVRFFSRDEQRAVAYTMSLSVEELEGGVQHNYLLQNLSVSPERPEPNSEFSSRIAVVNQGNINSVPTTIQLSVDDVDDASCNVPALTPGRSHYCNSVELSPIAEEGMHTLRACVDPENAVEETDEEDNCAEMEFEVGNPIPDQNDLWLRAPRISPDLPQADDFVTLRVQVMYTGDAQVDATTLEMRADGEIFSTCNVRSLDSRFHRSATCTSPGNVLQATSNDQVISLCADAGDQVEETDEENNCISLLLRAGEGLVGLEPDVYEEDNSYATGSFIADNFDANYAQVHNLHHPDDVDYVKFTMVREDILNVGLLGLAGQLDVRVIDNEISGDAGPINLLDIALDGANGNGTTLPLGEGTYAIVIRSADGKAVPEYKLRAWTDLGPIRPDAGPAPVDAGPAGECQNDLDCGGGLICNTDDSEPYCTQECNTVADCPSGFQLTCAEIRPAVRICIRGSAPDAGPIAQPVDPGAGCSCDQLNPGSIFGLLAFMTLIGWRRRRRA